MDTRVCVIAIACSVCVQCTCDRSKPAAQQQTQPKVRPNVQLRPVRPQVSIKHQMKDIQRMTMELRRRVSARLPPLAPARVLKSKLEKLPIHSFPAQFEPMLKKQISVLTLLERSKTPRDTFNRVVDQCINCHKVFAKPLVNRMYRMRLMKSAVRPAPRTSPKRSQPH